MSALPREKVNIIEHIIIKPDGSYITLPPTTNKKAEEPTTMDFDINTMPIIFEGVVMPENIETLPTPMVEQSLTTVTTTVPNIIQQPIIPLKLVASKSHVNPERTVLKTYSRKCKDTKNSTLKTSTTYCSLRRNRSSLSNKHIVAPPGSNTLLPIPSTSVVPATSTGSRLSSEASCESAIGRLVLVSSTSKNGHTYVQLKKHNGSALDYHNTLVNKQNKNINIPQQNTPTIKAPNTHKVSSKSCNLSSIDILPAVPGTSSKPHTVIATSKGEVFPAPLTVVSKVNKESPIATKPHGTCVNSISESILPFSRVSSKPRSSSTTTKAASFSPVHLSPKTSSSLSVEGAIGSTIYIQNKFESPSSAKKAKLEQDNVAVPGRTIIIKGTNGQIVKKLTGLENTGLKKPFQKQPSSIKASGTSVEMKSKHEAIAKSKLSKKKVINKKMSSVDGTTTKSVAFYDETSAKLLNIKTSGQKLTMSRRAASYSTQSGFSKLVSAKSPQFTSKTESVTPHQKKVVIPCDLSDNYIHVAPKETSDDVYVLFTVDEPDTIQLNDETFYFIDPILAGDVNNVMLQVDNSATFTRPTISESTTSLQFSNISVSDGVPAQTICALSSYNSASNQEQIIINLTEENQVIHNSQANADGNLLLQVIDNHSLSFTEQAGDVLFPRQPIRSQDILTAALADTDILQDTSIPSIDINLPPLSSNGVLHSTSVVNELKSSIMVTHEPSSINTKIISDGKTNILSWDVPKDVPLPITITDPNIFQLVSQKHLLVTGDQGMPFSVTEPGGVLLTSTQISSPSFVYLPLLDENTTQQQTYSSGSISMPSLNEDCSMSEIKQITDNCNPSTKYIVKSLNTDFSAILDSSRQSDFDTLSPVPAEPPSDMFDANMTSEYPIHHSAIEPEIYPFRSSSVTSSDDTMSTINSHSANINEDLGEIPVQPVIVTDLLSPYTTNSPFLTAYSGDQPINFSEWYNEDESNDESSNT